MASMKTWLCLYTYNTLARNRYKEKCIKNVRVRIVPITNCFEFVLFLEKLVFDAVGNQTRNFRHGHTMRMTHAHRMLLDYGDSVQILIYFLLWSFFTPVCNVFLAHWWTGRLSLLQGQCVTVWVHVLLFRCLCHLTLIWLEIRLDQPGLTRNVYWRSTLRRSGAHFHVVATLAF